MRHTHPRNVISTWKVIQVNVTAVAVDAIHISFASHKVVCKLDIIFSLKLLLGLDKLIVHTDLLHDMSSKKEDLSRYFSFS